MVRLAKLEFGFERKQMPLYVSVFVKSLDNTGFRKIFGYSRMTILDIEKALSLGELN